VKLVRTALSLAVVGALALTACGRDTGGEEAENLPEFVETFTADNRMRTSR